MSAYPPVGSGPPPQQYYTQPPQYGAPPPQYGAAPPTAAPPPAHTGADSSPLLKADGERFVPRSGCRDPLWSVFFIAHFIVVVVMSGMMYGKFASELSIDSSSGLSINKNTWGLLAIVLVLGAAVAAFWLQMIKSFANCLIYFTLGLSVAACIVFGIFLFGTGVVLGGVLMLILAAFNALYIYLIRERIAFSATILSIVAEALKVYTGTFVVAFGSVLFQAVWLIIWVLAAAGSIYSLDKQATESGTDNSTLTRLVYFFYLISFYWTSQVISNIVHVTTAGTIASWYFLAPHHIPKNPTVGAFKRASWTSFGSIAFGSFIIAVIKALRAMVRSARDIKNPFARCIVLCLLSCLDSMISYFNVYAFTQVAIYGKPYCEAAKDTWRLLASVGIDAIINDDIIGGVLVFASLVGGCMLGFIGALSAKFIFDITEWGYWVFISFMIGFAMTMICMEVVSSAVCALFVCFSEDSAALAASKPEVYGRFFTALTGHRYSASLHITRV